MTDVFFSYSREDARSPLFADFLEALVQEFAALGIRHFRDQADILPGDLWSPALLEALTSAKVFLYLLSPNYVESDYCGREWSVFEGRVHAAAGAPDDAPNYHRTMVPVWWTPVDLAGVHKKVADRQVGHGDFAQSYQRDGLRYLLKYSLRDARQCIDRIAGLVDAARRLELPAVRDKSRLRSVSSAFAVSHAGSLKASAVARGTPGEDNPEGIHADAVKSFSLDAGVGTRCTFVNRKVRSGDLMVGLHALPLLTNSSERRDSPLIRLDQDLIPRLLSSLEEAGHGSVRLLTSAEWEECMTVGGTSRVRLDFPLDRSLPACWRDYIENEVGMRVPCLGAEEWVRDRDAGFCSVATLLMTERGLKPRFRPASGVHPAPPPAIRLALV